MHRYRPTTHRARFAALAVALTAITIAVTVILPSRMAGADQPSAIAQSRAPAAVPATVEVATRFGRINVFATRAREVALQQGNGASKL
jgi:hypothetical protein